jgi:hypothetical protein
MKKVALMSSPTPYLPHLPSKSWLRRQTLLQIQLGETLIGPIKRSLAAQEANICGWTEVIQRFWRELVQETLDAFDLPLPVKGFGNAQGYGFPLLIREQMSS